MLRTWTALAGLVVLTGCGTSSRSSAWPESGERRLGGADRSGSALPSKVRKAPRCRWITRSSFRKLAFGQTHAGAWW